MKPKINLIMLRREQRRIISLRNKTVENTEREAAVCYRNGRYEEALSLYLELMRKYPRREGYVISCANCFDIIGRRDKAVELYKQALQINKKSLPALNNLTTALYESGDLKQAEKYCRLALRRDGENASALVNMGNIVYRKGRYREALDLYRHAAEKQPDFYIAEINIANTLYDLKDYGPAAEQALRSLRLNPSSLTAYVILGNSYLELDRYDEALSALKKALQLDSEDPWIYNSLSQVCQKKSQWEDALKYGWQAVEKSSGDEAQQINFGYTLYECALEKTDSLVKKYAENWRRRYPDNKVAAHMAAAVGNSGNITGADDDYVRNIFDVFAPDFESVLTALDYQAPAHIHEMLRRIYGEKTSRRMRILDAGCGTGFCGVFLKKYAAWRGLWGVDLSTGMLSVARQKKVYDKLFQEELTVFLKQWKNRFDLIVSADVLTYFGDLQNLFSGFADSLRKGGRILFTVSENNISGDAYFLHPSGRFLHSEKYIADLLRRHGLELEKSERRKLRNEGEKEVFGFVFSALKK